MENIYDEYMTLKESAALIGVALRTLYIWRCRIKEVSKDKLYKRSYVLQLKEKYAKKELVI